MVGNDDEAALFLPQRALSQCRLERKNNIFVNGERAASVEAGLALNRSYNPGRH
jgi:hypothetical protein